MPAPPVPTTGAPVFGDHCWSFGVETLRVFAILQTDDEAALRLLGPVAGSGCTHNRRPAQLAPSAPLEPGGSAPAATFRQRPARQSLSPSGERTKPSVQTSAFGAVAAAIESLQQLSAVTAPSARSWLAPALVSCRSGKIPVADPARSESRGDDSMTAAPRSRLVSSVELSQRVASGSIAPRVVEDDQAQRMAAQSGPKIEPLPRAARQRMRRVSVITTSPVPRLPADARTNFGRVASPAK